jgi:D-erythro-7,8-dihydroneopterin triphosphate epimerase
LDKIIIKDLLARGVIGLTDYERASRQDLLVNLVLHLDLSAAGRSDRIEDTVNYRTLRDELVALIERSSFYTIEKLAAEVARLCLGDQRIQQVEVTVEKPGALRFARSAAVTICREQGDKRL